MISLLMSFRAIQKENMIAFDKLLESIIEYLPLGSIELLVKLDNDDSEGMKYLNIRKTTYPFIKQFIFHRWEGRWSINYIYEYLFIHKNPESKYILMITDDMIFIRDFTNNIDGKSLIIGYFQEDITQEKMNKIKDYKSKEWLIPNYICSYPIINTKLIEIIGNFGYNPNPDSWFGLLNIIMYKKYKILLAKHIDEFNIRNNIDRIDNYGKNFNKEFRISDSEITNVNYIFKLAEQQVKNIYLNLFKENYE